MRFFLTSNDEYGGLLGFKYQSLIVRSGTFRDKVIFDTKHEMVTIDLDSMEQFVSLEILVKHEITLVRTRLAWLSWSDGISCLWSRPDIVPPFTLVINDKRSIL